MRRNIAIGLAAASLLAALIVFIGLASETETTETAQRSFNGVVMSERSSEPAHSTGALALALVPMGLAAVGLLAAAAPAARWPSRLAIWASGIAILPWALVFVAGVWLSYLPLALALLMAGAILDPSVRGADWGLPSARPLAALQLLSVRIALPAIALGLTLVALEAGFLYGIGYLALALPAYAATSVLVVLGAWLVRIRGWLFLLGVWPVATLGLFTLVFFIPAQFVPQGLLIWATVAAFEESGKPEDSAGPAQQLL